MSGDSETCGETGEGAAGAAGSGIEKAGGCLNGWDVQSKHVQSEDGIAESLYSGECRGGGGESYVMQSLSFQERAGKPGGGKGILIQEERTGALSTLNNQSVCAFEPGAASRVGGHVYEDNVAGTVRANAGDNQQAIAYATQACGDRDNPSQSYQEEMAYTVPANPMSDRGQAVVYGISSFDSNAMKSDNPDSGIYEAETTRTLDNNGGNPACNQGGMIVLEGNGARPSHMGNGYVESDTMYTLNATEHHSVCYRKQGHPQNAEQGQGWEQTEVNDTLNAFDNGESRTPTVVIENHPQDSRVKISEDGMVQTLSGKMGTGGGNVPMVMEQGTYQQTTGSLCASGYDKLGTQEALNDMYVVESSAWDGTQVSPTLTANNANGAQRMPDKDNFNAVLSVEPTAVSYGGFMVNADDSGKAHTLQATDYKDPQVVTYGLDRAAFNQGANAQYNFAIDEEKIGCQVAKGPGAVCSSIVRRLTPMECERLQGFPDHWTDIGEWVDSTGKKHKDADSPRYKALGNSIALPFWEWMAKRMQKYLHSYPPGQPMTMASLFDGIGGFPLSFSRAGFKPIWASEIEEFPIAVTKKHFPDRG